MAVARGGSALASGLCKGLQPWHHLGPQLTPSWGHRYTASPAPQHRRARCLGGGVGCTAGFWILARLALPHTQSRRKMRKGAERDVTRSTPPAGVISGGGAGPESYPTRPRSLGNPGQTREEPRLVLRCGGDAPGQGTQGSTQVQSTGLVLALEVVCDSHPGLDVCASVCDESWVPGVLGLGSGCCWRTPRDGVAAAQTRRPSPRRCPDLYKAPRPTDSGRPGPELAPLHPVPHPRSGHCVSPPTAHVRRE